MGLRSGFLRKNSRIQGKKRSKVGHLASIFDAVAVDFYQKYRRKPIADSPRVICARAREFQLPRAAVEQAQTERVFQAAMRRDRVDCGMPSLAAARLNPLAWATSTNNAISLK